MAGSSQRPAQGELAAAAPGESFADWRTQLRPEARQRIVSMVMEIVMTLLPNCEPECLDVLWKIAARFEEKIYTAAANQSDYSRTLKMLSVENKSQHSGSINHSTSNNTILNQNPADLGILAAGFDDYININRSATMDWRTELRPEARQSVIYKIMESLKTHLPIFLPESLNEIQEIAFQFEEKIYASANNQSDYFKKISLKMLSLGNKNQHSSSVNNQNPADSGYLFAGLMTVNQAGELATAPDGGSADWRTQLQPEARHRIVNKIMDTLKRLLPISVPEGLNELQKIANRFEEKIYTAAVNRSDYLRKNFLKMLSMELSILDRSTIQHPTTQF